VLTGYGLLQGMEIGLTNKALQYLTVSERTIMSSTTILFMMSTAWAWGIEGIDHLRAIACSLLVAGGMLQGIGQQTSGTLLVAAHVDGMIMQLASIAISTQRWALMQCIQQRSPSNSALAQISKLQLLSRVMPITGLVCIPLALVFEEGAYAPHNVLQPEVFMHLAIVAVSLTLMLSAELQLIKLLSAVAYNVIATVHQIPTVLCGVIFRHDQVDTLSACGFGCCLAGALVYARARSEDEDGMLPQKHHLTLKKEALLPT